MNSDDLPTLSEIYQLIDEIKNADISDFFDKGADGKMMLNWQKAKDKGSTRAVSEVITKDGKLHKIKLRNGQTLRLDKDGIVVAVKS